MRPIEYSHRATEARVVCDAREEDAEAHHEPHGPVHVGRAKEPVVQCGYKGENLTHFHGYTHESR
jgi:hypothetical protein